MLKQRMLSWLVATLVNACIVIALVIATYNALDINVSSVIYESCATSKFPPFSSCKKWSRSIDISLFQRCTSFKKFGNDGKMSVFASKMQWSIAFRISIAKQIWINLQNFAQYTAKNTYKQ